MKKLGQLLWSWRVKLSDGKRIVAHGLKVRLKRAEPSTQLKVHKSRHRSR